MQGHDERKGVGKHKGYRFRSGKIEAIAEDGKEYCFFLRVRSDGKITKRKALIKTKNQKEKEHQAELHHRSETAQKIANMFDTNTANKVRIAEIADNKKMNKGNIGTDNVLFSNRKTMKRLKELFPLREIKDVHQAREAIQQLAKQKGQTQTA